ncbi:MAG: hypothetical protein A3F72_09795 [Bacteroidetes bacterium RIFCSPLOWO2_12_FULL_35_15]|nr:MAG: hypothetical protein A3F72_09795 [Bacteroidetes bacterium RIFCSPLOWO2_12_FULL_35_15]
MKLFQLIRLSLFLCTLTSFGQVNPSWEKWIQANSFGVSISDTNDLHDLSFLKEILKNKKIIFLGENSHGVAEFTLLKSRMVRYLHDSLGFDVLAFESNAGDAYNANINIPTSDVQTSIYNSLSSLWHVEEIVPLFNYIKNTHANENPLNVAGVDFIASNGSFSFSRFLYELISPVNPSFAEKVKENDSLLTRTGVRGWTIFRVLSKDEKNAYYSQKDQQLKFYSNLINFMSENEKKFPQTKSRDIVAAKYYLQSRIDFIHWSNMDSTYMANKLPCIKHISNVAELWDRYRDYMMTQHLKFLYSTLYQGRKIIVWAENGHVAKKECRMPSDSSYFKEVYTISFQSYIGNGCYVMTQESKNTKPERVVYDFITPTDSLSIETIMHRSKHENTFIDMTSQTKCDGNSWMFEKSKMTGWEGDNTREENNVRKIYDGIMLINKISPPKYLKYDYEYLRKK